MMDLDTLKHINKKAIERERRDLQNMLRKLQKELNDGGD